MDILFRNRKVERLCNDAVWATRKLGPQCAKRLQQRLYDLSAAEVLDYMHRLPATHCEELKGGRKGTLSVRLEGLMRLIFEPANDPAPQKLDGGLDWKQVIAIRVLEIKDYHG